LKIFFVSDKINDSGEYILGARETGSHACYLIYGILKPGERGRELRPGAGHEEILLALSGDLSLTGQYSGILKQGQALHMRGEETFQAANYGTVPVVYVIAGGHSGEEHH
jgi:hypothetical protein